MLLRMSARFVLVLVIVAGFATANLDAQTTFTFGAPVEVTSRWEPVDGIARFPIQVNATAASVSGDEGAMSWQLRDGLLSGLQLTALDFKGGGLLLIDVPTRAIDNDPHRSIVGNERHHAFLDRRDRFILALPCLKGWQTASGETILFGTHGSHRERDPDTKAHGDPSVTPEPATMLLFGSGLAALGVMRRKYRPGA